MNDGWPGGTSAALQWQRHQSAHFAFWFMPGSQVEKNVMALATRLEAIRDATVRTLDLKDLAPERLQVYLSDLPPGVQQQEEDGQVWEMGEQRIIAIYLSEARSGVLERAIVELLMTSSLNVSAARATLLVDGMLGFVAQQAGDGGLAETNAALLKMQGEGRRVTLASFLQGPTAETKAVYRQVVTSFVAYLFATYGVEAFKRFAQGFEDPNRASQAAYGKPLAALEAEWLASLQAQPAALGASKQARASAPGVMGFLRRALAFLRPYWTQQVVILLATAIGSIFIVSLPLSFGFVVNQLSGMDGLTNYFYIMLVIVAIAILFLIQAPATIFKEYLAARVGARVMNDLRMKMFEHLQRLSTDFYTRTRPGDIASRFSNDLSIVEVALTKMLPLLVSLVITFLAGLIGLFITDWLLALVVVVALPVLFIIPSRLGKRAAKVLPEQQRNKAMVSSTIQENIGAQQVIKAYSLQEMTLQRFQAQLDRLGNSVARGGFLSTLPGTSAILSVSLIQVLTLAIGVFLIWYGYFTVGGLTAFTGLIGVVTAPLTSLSQVLQLLLQASAGMQRVDEFLDEKPQVEDAPDARPLGSLSREIQFQNVDFSYTGEQVNLRNLNLTIPAGQTVAFVGPSGSGKSTVLSLIMRFYDPTTGSVTVDGQDLRRATQRSLRGQIGAVFQETFLYNATVRENIRLGKTDATEADIERAAKAAEIHDFVLTLPQGYDTPVGERGGRLSGGQKQRIALARAILYDPAILVLDEPTSALDPQTEAAVNATLEKMSEGRTVLNVTHRLASVVNADRVVVLERGEVVEQGTHEELLKAKGLYYRLWGQQNGFSDEAEGGDEPVTVGATRLQTIPFFANLGGNMLTALASRFEAERHAERTTVFEEGDPGDKMYFIDRGEVEVVVTGPTGEERRAALLRDGDYFGEMALLEDVPRAATVRTRAPSVLLSLDRRRFLNLLKIVPDLRAAFERGVQARRQANYAVLRGTVRAGER